MYMYSLMQSPNEITLRLAIRSLLCKQTVFEKVVWYIL